jgi:hypothetical protein
MIGHWVASAAVALVCSASLSTDTISADPLWQKAVTLSETNRDWIPGTVHEHEIVYDNDGDPKESTERTYSFLLREGELDIRLVAATKNGEDAFEDAAEELEKEKDDLLSDDPKGDPFHTDNQDALQPRRLDRTEIVDGALCILFEYEIERKGGRWSGTAWLDEASGAPLRTCIRPAEFPHKIRKVEFSDLEITTSFRVDEYGRWITDRVEAKGQFKVKPIPFYTFKGRFEEATTFSDYWWHER